MGNYHVVESTLTFIKGFTAAGLQVMSSFWAFHYENLAIRDSDLIGLSRDWCANFSKSSQDNSDAHPSRELLDHMMSSFQL